MAKNHPNTFHDLSDLSSLLPNNSASDHQNKQTNQQPNNQSTPKTKKQSPHSSPKQRKFRLSAPIIDQYQELEIFKRINPHGLREPDIVILHNLARKLLQNNPDLSSENILKNQISLYEFMRQKFRQYNRTKHTDGDKNQMRQAIKKKLAALSENPLIDQLYENNKETHTQIIKAILQSAKNDSPYEAMPEFLDSAAQLADILESEKNKQKAKEKETSTPATDSVDSSQESKQTLSVEDKDENLPSPSPGNSHNTKLIWRRFTNRLANKLDASFDEEDIDDDIFSATITTEKSTTFIQATSANNISLSAQDNDGDPIVPEQKIFYELAQNALDNHKTINFSNIQTPEFKARLMIACMTKGVIMLNAPQIDDDFLNSIDKRSRLKLQNLKNGKTLYPNRFRQQGR